MSKNSRKNRFGIVDFALIDAGISHHEALIVSYVRRFEKNKRPCFASIPHIAAELRFSESATKRGIRRLIELKILTESSKGRGRYLNTNGVKMTSMIGVNLAPTRSNLTSNGVKMTRDRGQNDLWDRGQNDPLPIKDIPIKDTYIKSPKEVTNNARARDPDSDDDWCPFD